MSGSSTRRRWLRRCLVAVVAMVTVGVAATWGRAGSQPNRSDTPIEVPATAEVVESTLVDRVELDAALGYGETATLSVRRSGAVTALAAEGTTVSRDGSLLALDGQEVILLEGAVPAYRRLAGGVEDGVDIEQLEQNLITLGHGGESLTEADQEWERSTTAAVRRWQQSHGFEEDGVVEDGEVIFRAGPTRVAQHQVDLGTTVAAGTPALTVTGATQVVTVDLDARLQRYATAGDSVEVELPDGTSATGKIFAVGSVAEQPAEGDADASATIAVTIVLDDSGAAGGLDGAPATVRLTREERSGVLAVPVEALLALSEGGYGLEVVDGTTTSIVAVDTGLFADGRVEVDGDGIEAGLAVVVPS